MPPTRPKVVPEPEPEPDVDIEDEDEGEEFEEMDMFEALSSLLTTEDGETIATALVGLKEATDKIATCLEVQNKILLKVLTELKKSKTEDATDA